MQFQTLAYTEKDGILHVKFNRPEKRNAVSPQVVKDLKVCFDEVASVPSVKVRARDFVQAPISIPSRPEMPSTSVNSCVPFRTPLQRLNYAKSR
jgi:hypothetical protein